MSLYALGEQRPTLSPSAWVAPGASVIGDVQLGDQVSIWFGAVLRGDNEPIRIGNGSNVQENAVLHVDHGCPIEVGENVTIGHQAMLHGCSIGDNSLIGIQAVVLNRARIGRNCLVGAGALVTEGKVFEDGWLILGSPAKAVRRLSEEEIAGLAASAASYRAHLGHYATELTAWTP
ncbi:MAG: gamma carbonic anhydrase family protein [Lautropia sp.]|nr:gamma carbonic anhydrase family protein [Lautropia sp.]